MPLFTGVPVRLSLQLSLLLSIVVLLATPGCTTTSKTVRIFPNDFPKLSHRPADQRVKGESCGSASLLGIRLSSGPKIVDAIEEALKHAGSEYNALADVQVREQFHLKGILTFSCVSVNGLPLRFGKAGLPDKYIPAHTVPNGTKEEQWDF